MPRTKLTLGKLLLLKNQFETQKKLAEKIGLNTHGISTRLKNQNLRFLKLGGKTYYEYRE